jgi:hypothetical protein
MFQYDTHKSLEQNIREYLTDYRLSNAPNFRVPMFALYTKMGEGFSNLSAAVFNKVIGDMKKAGIVQTIHGQEVFLSDAAWQLYCKTPHKAPVKIDSSNPFGGVRS